LINEHQQLRAARWFSEAVGPMKSTPLGNFCVREPRAGIDRKALNNFVAGQGAPVMALRVSRLRVH
jgi:hypothetical protein